MEGLHYIREMDIMEKNKLARQKWRRPPFEPHWHEAAIKELSLCEPLPHRNVLNFSILSEPHGIKVGGGEIREGETTDYHVEALTFLRQERMPFRFSAGKYWLPGP